jgi:hypothetical protein
MTERINAPPPDLNPGFHVLRASINSMKNKAKSMILGYPAS